MITNILLTMALLCSTQPAGLKSQGIRSTIKLFIEEKYPDAKVNALEDVGKTYYLNYTIQKSKYVASFSLNGNWIQTEKKIKMPDVPQNVKQGFASSKYSSGKILAMKEVEYPNGPQQLYFLEVQYDNHDGDETTRGVYKLYFTPQGSMIKDELEPLESFSNEP